MTVTEVVNKLALELALKTGDFDDLKMYKETIQMAVTIGIVHFTKDMEEVIAMDYEGVEQGRYKGVRDAAAKLGLNRGNIYQVLQGRRRSVGGYMFIRTKDKVLVER